jgi:methionyl-tRNA formyltransferase
MRLVFMGTPEFSVPSLERLASTPHEIAAIVTRPDVPKGRGRSIQPPPAKVAAERLGLPVHQVETLRDEASLDLVRSFAPDLIVVVAFRIVPPEMLAIPRFGAVNVHASLLPKYRGAAPIQRAIIEGEERTGVTVFLLEPTVDTGGILRQRAVDIGPDETFGELYSRLSQIGAEEIIGAVNDIAAGTAHPLRQDDTEATPAPKLRREDGRIDWTLPTERIRNLVRGTNPEPGAYAYRMGEPFGVLRVDRAEDAPAGAPGEAVMVDPRRGIAVAAADGAVWLTTVKPAGKKPMDGAAWVRGARPERGELFG